MNDLEARSALKKIQELTAATLQGGKDALVKIRKLVNELQIDGAAETEEPAFRKERSGRDRMMRGTESE